MGYKKRTIGEWIFDIFNHIILLLFAFSTVYPFINLISISFSTPSAANSYGLRLIPKEFTADPYKTVFSNPIIWTGYANTLYRTILGTTLNVLFTVMGAYPLSKKYLPNRNFYTSLIVFTMFFGGGLIPNYLLIKQLGLLENRMVLILPGLVSAYNMIIVRNYFMSLPEEIEDSAKIDGANEIRILFSIILPISIPIIATVTLWYAVGHWNAWFDCLLYITDPQKTVLQTILQKIVVQGSVQFSDMSSFDPAVENAVMPDTIKAATVVVATVPILCVYPFVQKYFVKGVMLGSLKG
jgi:putative aldouronate transport system permease protein